MKIGIQTSEVLDILGIEHGFQLIHESGFDCVDFNIDHCLPYDSIVSGDPHSLFDKSDAEILDLFKPYKEAAVRWGIEFGQAHAPFPSWVKDKPESNEYVIMAIEKCMMICNYVGCGHIVVHPFFLGYDDALDAQQEWELNIRQYSKLIPAAKKYNVTVCLENMFSAHNGKIYSAICQEPDEAARYIDSLNAAAGEKRFAFCLDVGHALLGTQDLRRVVLGLGTRLEVLHLHDNNGLNDQHLAPYMGILDWDRLCQALKEVGYSGVLSFETYNALRVFDRSLTPQVLALIAASGRLFAEKVSGQALDA